MWLGGTAVGVIILQNDMFFGSTQPRTAVGALAQRLVAVHGLGDDEQRVRDLGGHALQQSSRLIRTNFDEILNHKMRKLQLVRDLGGRALQQSSRLIGPL